MNLIEKSKFKKLVAFIPLLLIYIILIVFFSPDQLVGDEGRYVGYATNITNGFYADASDPSIRNGPAYPLVISLPILANVPYILIRFLNIGFLAMALVLFYKLLALYIKPSQIIPICYLLGLYPPLARGVTGILSESLSILLVCGFLFYFIKLNTSQSKQQKHVFLSGLFLGVLALTKVIFGYVIICGIICCCLFYLFKKSKKVKLSLFTFILSFLCCIPYLAYTQHITGKTFLWGTQGGEMLYWRSTPFEHEYGDWISPDIVLGKTASGEYEFLAVSKNHGEFISSLEPYSAIQKDSLYKEKAVENIKKYPVKFARNTIASGFRLFYNYPYSYKPLKVSTYLYLVPNTVLITFSMIAVFLILVNIKRIPFEIQLLGILTMVFIGGLTLLDGRVRHLLPVIPILIFGIAYIFNSFLQIKLVKEKSNGLKQT